MRNKLILFIMIFLVIGNSIPAYCDAYIDGDGKEESLYLEESIPENGAQNVELDTQIKLVFNKNVVNSSVKDNNSQCFVLMDEKNSAVTFDLIFADDQVEPDKKREIILKPKEALKGNMNYKVEILPGLQSKNGTSLDKSITVSFTTLTSLPEETAQQSPAQTPEETQNNQDSYVWPVIVVISAALISAVIIIIKKRKL